MSRSQSTTDKAASLLALIAHGLHAHAEQSTALTLGDRSRYIGLSDIGRALECPRAALCNKLFPRPQPDLQKLLTLQRGHWLEHGIGQALAAHSLNILPQLELSLMHNGVPIKAHLDFVLVWEQPRPAVRILELKSTERLPETLYTSYECQLYGQAGLLARMWNHPAFSVKDEYGTILHGNLTMPELCGKQFGLRLPSDSTAVDIEAWVLCLSMSDAKAFGPYLPNDAMCDLCLNTAETLWTNKLAVESGRLDVNAVAYASGFHALCAYCDWNADCPKFHDGEYQPEWQADLQRLASLKDSRTVLDEEIEELETSLKDAYALSCMAGDWINADTHRFRVSLQAGRRTLDRAALREALETLFRAENLDINVDALLARCEREGRPFRRLTINPINKTGEHRGLLFRHRTGLDPKGRGSSEQQAGRSGNI